MASLHSTLTGADLHEVKGAAGATAGHTLRADGLGSAAFVLPSTLENVLITSLLTNQRTADILPVAVDTPTDAIFDGTQSNSDVTMNASGLITLNTAGVYQTTFNLCFGRTAGAGNAIIAAWLELNGTQFGFTQVMRLSDAVASHPININIIREYSAGDTLKVRIIRDSSGINNGGLIYVPLTYASIADPPSYWVRITKHVGIS